MFCSSSLDTRSVSVPVCKGSDESSSVNYLESDTVWINPSKGPGPRYPDPDTSSHLYINKICPPEYSELDTDRSSYRNINHCSQVVNIL